MQTPQLQRGLRGNEEPQDVRQSHDLTRYVPDADGLVQRGRGHQILSGMELGTHHIVVVPRQDTGGREREGNDT